MEKIREVLRAAAQELFAVEITPTILVPEEGFGDYSTNLAMVLAKQLGRNPRKIADEILDALAHQQIEFDAVMAGPGFINFTLHDYTLIDSLTRDLENKHFAENNIYQDQVVVSEFSDPNPFKVLHIGHFYTSVVGDAISNLIELAGGKVHRVNFGGDTGLHVAKTMWAIMKNLDGENLARLNTIEASQRTDWVSQCYVEGNTAYSEDDEAKLEIVAVNKHVYQVTDSGEHDSNFAKIYWTVRQWSYDYFDEFYQSIGVKFEKYYPESETGKLGREIVREHPEVYTKSHHAIVFDATPYGLHTRVFINSEGLPTYETKDMGCTMQKYADYHFDKHIIITANDIIEYMKVVLKSIEQFAPKVARSTVHYTHGLVKLPGGVKQSSRLGNTVKATAVIEMVASAQQEQYDNRDRKLVLGAIKYAFLKNRLGPDLVFDPESSVSLNGNSGPYLQYSVARAKSILKKAAATKSPTLKLDQLDDFERLLAIKLYRFQEILRQATSELAPHQICSYLYELATVFNRFYENSPVVGNSRQALRLKLVEQYQRTLTKGLKILGVETMEKM